MSITILGVDTFVRGKWRGGIICTCRNIAAANLVWEVTDKVPGFGDLGRMLMLMGAFLLILGALFSFGGRFPGLGRLPGDIVIRRGNFTFYFPFMTSVLGSLALTLLLWLLRRR